MVAVLDQLGIHVCFNAESDMLGVVDQLGIQAVMQSDILGVLDQLGIQAVMQKVTYLVFWINWGYRL